MEEREGSKALPREEQACRKVMIVILAVIAVVLVGWALKATSIISAPLAFAFFMAVLVYPVQRAVARRLPDRMWWVATFCAMILIVIALLLFFGAGWLAWETVNDKAETYQKEFQSHWEQMRQWLLGRGIDVRGDLISTEDARSRLLGWVKRGITTIGGLLTFLTLVFFLMLLMLLESDEWREKSKDGLSTDHSEKLLDTTRDIADAVRRYLLIRIFVSSISAVCGGLWLWAVGIDFALLWGLLIFFLNFIPNVGSVISSIAPAAVAFVQPDGSPWQAIAAIVGLTVIEQVIGNFLDPRLQGRTLQISPLVILISLVFWYWMWGIAGALLAVPMTATIVIIMHHVEALKPLARLGSRPS